MSNYKLRRRRSRARAPSWSTKPPERWNRRDVREFSQALGGYSGHIMRTVYAEFAAFSAILKRARPPYL